MWCVFHNAQWYWSDNLCKLVTDQWRGSLGVCDSESCCFTEEIGTYMRCWESPGDLPLVIEIFVSFRSFRCAPLAKRHNISITRGRSPVIPKNVCKNLLFLLCRPTQTLDTSLHSGLLYKLLTNNVGCKCFNVIQNIYSLCQSAIKIDNKHSDYFTIERWVKQSGLFKLLFI